MAYFEKNPVGTAARLAEAVAALRDVRAWYHRIEGDKEPRPHTALGRAFAVLEKLEGGK